MKKNHCLPILLLFVSVFLCSCTATQTKNETVDIKFAKRLSDLYRNDAEQRTVLVRNYLDNLSRSELYKLKIIIKEDITRQSGVIVSPALPVEYRIIKGLLNDIDDRLGILDYNLVVEGQIVKESMMPSTVSWFFFKPIYGPEIEIYIGSSTIMPVGNYDDIIKQKMRIFIKVYRNEAEQGKLFRSVVKIELLMDDPIYPQPK